MSLCTCLVRASTSTLRSAISARSLHTSSLARQAETAAPRVADQTSSETLESEGEASQSRLNTVQEHERLLQHSASGLAPPLDENVQVEEQQQQPQQQQESSSAAAQIDDDTFRVLERRRRLHLMNSLESIGSSQTRNNTWQPHHTLSRSHAPASLTLSHLLASTAHLGHSTSLSSPMAFPYIYGTRHGISIIDVRETLTALRRAAALVRSTVENDGIVLFLGGGMKETEKVLAKNAAKLGRNGYSTNKWLPGTLTNSSRLFSESSNLIAQPESGEDGCRRGGRVNVSQLRPSLMVLFSPLSTPNALREANSYNVPTIALCDSNVDPRNFTYPIPCNDDSVRVAELVSGVLAEAGKEGISRRLAKLNLQRQQQQTISGRGGEARYTIADTAASSQDYRFPDAEAQ